MSAQEPPFPPSAVQESEPWSSQTSLPPLQYSDSTQQLLRFLTANVKRIRLPKLARRTLGISLLLVTVFLWTASNFLASDIFADNTYSKPYFVTYINTSFFAVTLVPIFARRIRQEGLSSGSLRHFLHPYDQSPTETAKYTEISSSEEDSNALKLDDEIDATNRDDSSSLGPLLVQHSLDGQLGSSQLREPTNGALNLVETAKLSLEFCVLWFVANYFAAGCLKYTTVASATILTSTSSIWTLLLGALIKVEKFTLRKLVGVLASIAGVVLISTVDLSADNDENRGSFPHKSHGQIAIGDAMAFFSAIVYGLYTILMKKRIGDEARVNMPIFFGLVGLFNVLLLWPGFLILHFTGEEIFQLPPSGRIWAIVLINSVTSLLSDVCWAYAMLLTSPLVVTVGLSLTIPLSLIGQMIIDAQYSSVIYWIGACIVFLSFIFINHESKEEDLANANVDFGENQALQT